MENSIATKAKEDDFESQDTLAFKKPRVIVLASAIILIIILNLIRAILTN